MIIEAHLSRGGCDVPSGRAPERSPANACTRGSHRTLPGKPGANSGIDRGGGVRLWRRGRWLLRHGPGEQRRGESRLGKVPGPSFAEVKHSRRGPGPKHVFVCLCGFGPESVPGSHRASREGGHRSLLLAAGAIVILRQTEGVYLNGRLVIRPSREVSTGAVTGVLSRYRGGGLVRPVDTRRAPGTGVDVRWIRPVKVEQGELVAALLLRRRSRGCEARYPWVT